MSQRPPGRVFIYLLTYHTINSKKQKKCWN